MKKLILAAIAAAMILTCAGCAKKNADDSDTSFDDVKTKGELIVGLDDTFAPMGFRDEQGKLVGFDIDLATAVCEQMGVKVKFQPIVWDTKELELSSKRIDVIWNGMSANPSRYEEMQLTKVYLNNELIIMTNEGVSVSSKADLAKLRVGVQADSGALDAMKADGEYESFKASISEYPTYDEVILDMLAGRLDCMVVDKVLGEYKNSKLDKKLGVSEITFGDDYYVIGCRKGELALVAAINDAMKECIDSGKSADISEKWFGTDVVVLDDYKPAE